LENLNNKSVHAQHISSRIKIKGSRTLFHEHVPQNWIRKTNMWMMFVSLRTYYFLSFERHLLNISKFRIDQPMHVFHMSLPLRNKGSYWNYTGQLCNQRTMQKLTFVWKGPYHILPFNLILFQKYWRMGPCL
jgi:hypothetical protein